MNVRWTGPLFVLAALLLALGTWGTPFERLSAAPVDGEYANAFDSEEPLAEVRVEGNVTIPPSEILKHIKSRPRRPATEKQVREDVRALYNLKWFYSVEPRLRTSDDGPVLIYRVQERPILKKVSFEGNSKIKTKDLEGLTGMKPGGAYDVTINREAARRIESYYREKGHLHAKVSLKKGDQPDDRDVVFAIEEGPRVHVTSVSFEGNQFFSSALLHTKLKTSTRKLWLFGGKFDPATIPEDVASLKDYYHSLGFFDVKIEEKSNRSKDGNVQIKYVITEGTRYKVRNIEYAGNKVIPDEQLKKDRKLHENEYFAERFLNADVTKMTNRYGEMGRIFAQVDPQPRFTETPGIVDIVFRINEDQVQRVRRINVHIDGEHPHTREAEVLTRMRIKPGDLADPRLIKKSEQTLRGSQLFAGMNPGSPDSPRINVSRGEMKQREAQSIVRAQGINDDRPVSPLQRNSPQGDPLGSGLGNPGLPNFSMPPPGWVDLDVNVAETQTGRLMFGVGVNSDAGVVGSVILEENNFDLFRPPTSFQDFVNGTAFRGGGQRFRAEAVPGDQVSRYLLSWTDPYFLDQDVSFGVSGFYYTRFFPDWDETRLGGRLSLGHQFTPEVSGSVALRMENVDLNNPTKPTPSIIARDVGESFLSTVRVAASHDTRDSPFLAGKGHFVELAYEQGFGEYTYPRVDLDARQYFTLRERPDGGGRWILTTAGQLGWSGEETPVFERYFAGGFSSMRGFAFRGVTPREGAVGIGGQFSATGTVEAFVPITADDNFGVVAFTDFGTVQRDNVSLDDFRVAIGGGFRITVPAMGPVPIALDFAYPIVREEGDKRRLFSFYVGFMR